MAEREEHPVEEFIADATRRYPRVRYLTGTAEQLDVPDGQVGGILAWYSFIYLHPAQLNLACSTTLVCDNPVRRAASGQVRAHARS